MVFSEKNFYKHKSSTSIHRPFRSLAACDTVLGSQRGHGGVPPTASILLHTPRTRSGQKTNKQKKGAYARCRTFPKLAVRLASRRKAHHISSRPGSFYDIAWRLRLDENEMCVFAITSLRASTHTHTRTHARAHTQLHMHVPFLA